MRKSTEEMGKGTRTLVLQTSRADRELRKQSDQETPKTKLSKAP